MRVRHRSSMAILPLVLLGLTAAILSCAPVETGPRAWIDWPRDGFETDVGTTVTVIAHAYARGGVAEVHLAVDMQPYRVVPPDLAGEEFVEVSTEWIADEPGTYLLSVTAFDAAGGASNPASVTVSVVGDAPQLIITPGGPTDTPTSTGVPTDTPISVDAPTDTPTSTGEPTDTPTSTGIPTDTPTSTPSSTATTPPRVVITMFEASKTQIMAGECPVIFTWRVEAPTAIYFDGEGVTDNPGSRDRCPESTRTYELVANGYLGPVTASITIVVIQPPTDTEGPLIQNEAGPQEMWAPDGNQCRGLEPYQFQANVSDVSGVLWVKLIYSVDGGPDQSGGMQLVSGTTYRTGYSLPDLGGQSATFEWHIRGCDMVDPMNCSDSATHTESMFDCPI